MKINLKSFIIKVIFLVVVAIIITGMLKGVALFSFFGAIHKVLKIVCLLICVMYFIFFIKVIKNKFIKFLVLFLCYEIFITIFTQSFNFPNGIIDVLLWQVLLVIFYEYTTTKNNYAFISKSIYWIYILLVVLSFYLISIHLSGMGKAGSVIFPTYFLLSMLPLVFKFQDEKKHLYFIFVSIVLMILTTKRTGFFVAIIGGVLYLFSNSNLNDTAKKKIRKYIKYIVIMLFFSGILFYVGQEEIQRIFTRLNSIFLDQGSGRVNIWKNVLIAFSNSSFIEKVLGHGTQSVMYQLKPGNITRFAHNSYIEFLYDYGIIGLLLLLIFMFILFKKLFMYRKLKNKNFSILLYIFVLSVFLSLFSYYFEQSFIILPIAIILGIIFGEEERE